MSQCVATQTGNVRPAVYLFADSADWKLHQLRRRATKFDSAYFEGIYAEVQFSIGLLSELVLGLLLELSSELHKARRAKL